MLTYVVIAVLAVASLLSLPEVSFFLESNMHKIIGPLLIVVGIILLDVIPISFSASLVSSSVQEKAGKWGIWGSGLLGIIFALTFCRRFCACDGIQREIDRKNLRQIDTN
jgi:cytochrome c-type biogenesis protein